MELREELKKLGKMALWAIVVLFVFAAIGGAIGYGVKSGDAFSIVAGVVVFIVMVVLFFVVFKKKRQQEIDAKKTQDEINKLKKNK